MIRNAAPIVAGVCQSQRRTLGSEPCKSGRLGGFGPTRRDARANPKRQPTGGQALTFGKNESAMAIDHAPDPRGRHRDFTKRSARATRQRFVLIERQPDRRRLSLLGRRSVQVPARRRFNPCRAKGCRPSSRTATRRSGCAPVEEHSRKTVKRSSVVPALR